MKETATNRIFRDLETAIQAKHYSKDTLSAYQYGMKIFCDYFHQKEHPTHVNDHEIEQFIAWVNENHSVSQGRACFWAVRFYFRNVEDQPNKMERLKPPKTHRKAIIPISPDKILDAIQKTQDKKHKAVLAVLFSTGLRRNEVSKIRIEDVNVENGVIVVHEGKGGKDRLVPLNPLVLEILRDYLREMKLRGKMPKTYLFESSRTPGNWMSRSTPYRICKDDVGINTHAIRRTYATDFYKNTHDLLTLGKILGHKSPKTTAIYVDVSTEQIRDAYNPMNQI